jgi:hypothetical protein
MTIQVVTRQVALNKLDMEKFTLEEEIKVFCETAKSFPDGIMKAHQELESILTCSKQRRYFGITSRNAKGNFVYDAAAEEIYQGEAEELGCEKFLIERGQYISLLIENYKSDISAIGKAFELLTAYPGTDPQGYCIEWYLDENDVRCMVKLAN